MTVYPEQYTLQEVVVKVPKVRVKGDTITYDVASYTSGSDRSIEDVIKKIPGIEVSENGAIMYDGEPINNFYIEGLNLMGNNYQVASRNISPADISTISVYERHQPKKVLKDVVESKTAALNLKLKKKKMLKPVGFVKGAAGEGDHMLWSGQIYTMAVTPRMQTIISARGNNTGNDYLSDRNSGDHANNIFIRKPFGTPSLTNSRYIFNKSAHFSANSMLKTREDATLTVNASYGLDHDDYDSFSSTLYLGTEMENPIYSETVINGLMKHVVNTEVKFERNSNRIYLSDQVNFSGAFNHNGYDINNGYLTLQSLRNHNYVFSNKFSTAIKTGSKVLEINSLTSFSHTPLNRMEAENDLTEATSIMQEVSGLRFHNSETTGMVWKTAEKSSVGANLSFSIDRDIFRSASITNGEAASLNNVEGHNISTRIEPLYKYAIPGKFGVEISLPIDWKVVRYDNAISHVVNRHNKLYLNPATDIFFKFTRVSYLDVSASWTHSVGDIMNFVDNPVYTTFRNQVTPGSGHFVNSLAKSANASYSFRNPLEGFYLRSSLSFIHRTTNSLSSYDVDNQGTSTSSFNINTTSQTTNFNASIVKYISRCNIRLALDLNGIWISRESMRASKIINSHLDNYITAFSASTDQLNGRLSISANVSFSLSRQTFGGAIPDNNISEMSATGKFSYCPIKQIELYAKAYFNCSELSDNNYKENLFLDAGIRYIFNKFELEIYGRNLTDRCHYQYTLYRTLDLSTYSYTLRPIEGIISLKYNF